MNPLISVIIPIYDVEDYLCRCVDSIINQTYKNLEIILVDDGSPDNCPKICDDYSKKDNRIKVIHKENGGLSDARNAGLKVATGDYISFIDSDDWIDVETFALTMDRMQKTNSQIGAFNIISVSDDNFSANLSDEFEVMNSQQAIENTIDNVKVKTVVWNKIYKREILEGLFFKKGKYNEDEFFTFYALDRAESIVYLYRQCYYYFQRNTSIMGSYNLKRLDMLDGVKERMDFVKKHYPEIYLKAKLSLCMCCVNHYQMILKHKGIDKDKKGRDKIKSLRCNVRLTNKDIANLRFIEKVSQKFANTSLGLSFICRVRNIVGYGL